MSRNNSYRRSQLDQAKRKSRCLKNNIAVKRSMNRWKKVLAAARLRNEDRKSRWSRVFRKFLPVNQATFRGCWMAMVAMFAANRKAVRPRRSTGSFVPRPYGQLGLEGLEDRAMLSINVTLSAGNLDITSDTGSGQADELTLQLDPTGTDLLISDAGNFFMAGGLVGDGTMQVTVPLADITSGINVDTRDGVDLVRIDGVTGFGGDLVVSGLSLIHI